MAWMRLVVGCVVLSFACAQGTPSGGGGRGGSGGGNAGNGGNGGGGNAGGGEGGSGGGAGVDAPADPKGVEPPRDAAPDLPPDLEKEPMPDVSYEPGAEVYVLGAAGADCKKTCAAIGKTCGGSGSVGLACKVHTDVTTCNESANWIYRAMPASPVTECLASWGTSDVCTYNYNVYNAFCCKCL